ncbi:hypothetical protein [Oryza sativa Japonica Group]|uniref:Uncharacterized protein n=1 Tax=Oryza sativa subsp. japonica TaxID=39947 RepID=Q8W0F4_ORYSJ|nr:hypothetical protein [Oryza sativa Japonica Group]BAD82452.1 hypothetical protein [Oryza sativa Japonica Group]
MVVVTLAVKKGGGRPEARWGEAEEEEGGAATAAAVAAAVGLHDGQRWDRGAARRAASSPFNLAASASYRPGPCGSPQCVLVFMQRNYHGLEDKSPGCSNFLALAPWTPPQIATASNWSSSDSEKREFFEVPMESNETEVDSMDVEESPEANAAAIDGESLHQWAVATTLHDPIVATKPFSTCYVFKVTSPREKSEREREEEGREEGKEREADLDRLTPATVGAPRATAVAAVQEVDGQSTQELEESFNSTISSTERARSLKLSVASPSSGELIEAHEHGEEIHDSVLPLLFLCFDHRPHRLLYRALPPPSIKRRRPGVPRKRYIDC